MGRERALAGVILGFGLLAGARLTWPRTQPVRLPCAPAALGRTGDAVTCGGTGLLTQGERRVLGLPLELNRATAEELDALPGIGAALAARIVADRAERGPYPSVEALARVPGIGPGKRRLLEGRVTVRPER